MLAQVLCATCPRAPAACRQRRCPTALCDQPRSIFLSRRDHSRPRMRIRLPLRSHSSPSFLLGLRKEELACSRSFGKVQAIKSSRPSYSCLLHYRSLKPLSLHIGSKPRLCSRWPQSAPRRPPGANLASSKFDLPFCVSQFVSKHV